MAKCNLLSTYSYPASASASASACFLCPEYKRNCAVINGKRKSASACSTSIRLQKWNISKDVDQGCSSSSSFSEEFRVEYKRKMGEIKQSVLQQYYSSSNNSVDEGQGLNTKEKESLILVDAIQRVGMQHHFEEEIQMILQPLYHSISTNLITFAHHHHHHHHLYYVSLCFRLFRNQGYHVSPDMFSIFKGNDGKFKERLKQDIRGLMELHEASQLRFKDEDIIDEAQEFSKLNLNKYLELENSSIKDDDFHFHKRMINNSLRQPQHKNIARLTARNNTTFVKSNRGWENTLSDLAKMDYSMAERLHLEELAQIAKWWENVGIGEDLERARSQPVKWYTWSMALLIDNPDLQLERIQLTKAAAFIYIIDDIFDLYGTIDELTLLTQAIDRWEYDAIHTIPEYMRKTYRALLDTINGIAQQVEKKYGTNPIDSLKATWGSLCRAFLVEARWFRSGKFPAPKEYLENGQISSGVHVVAVHLFFLQGLGTGHSSVHLNDISTLVSSIATLLRLADDLGSAKDEDQDGSDGSYIKCCMDNEPKLSEKEALQHVEDMMSDHWKNLNEECFLRLNHSSLTSFRRASLNFARMIPLMYTYDENQRLPLLEEHIDTTNLFN